MNTKNLTIREGLKTLKTNSADSSELTLQAVFVYGLRFANDNFAIPALQELNCRGASDIIVAYLDAYIALGIVKPGSVFATTLISTLCELDRTIDPLLCTYGKALRSEGVFMGPSDWLRANADRYRNCWRSGMVKDAKPWAKAILFPDGYPPTCHHGDKPVVTPVESED